MTAEQIKEAAPKAETATHAAPEAATAAVAAPEAAPVQKEADPADDIGLIQPMGVEQ